MNTGHIKSYAPRARNDFIAAMTKQAAKYGITAKAIEPAEVKGDLLVIGGKPFPIVMAKPREALIRKIKQTSFGQVMEQVAYSWFNRLCAIRYMELADYLGHGRRVLSHPQQQNGYQILEECLDIDLAGLDKDKARQLKLDGNKDEALYRLLLLAQCHALHNAMPFLFEPVDDETELLLPENLTKTDSLIRDLVSSIPEQDWANIEIIGWLYQFYISEKKDQVIGKVVKSEDIPAATQLFTPNWIVKYMVQNSLGAQWLATYPQSPLKGQMEYYIEPAEQTDEVNSQLKEITPAELNPEELTLIDPASGSGHILVEAYDLFKAIYLERGYRQRDIAGLILEKNLFGLDIDERAAQLTGFALMMKGRADDRSLFENKVKLNVMPLVDSVGFDSEVLVAGLTLVDYGLDPGNLNELKELFKHATTFGSLIQVPEELAKKMSSLKRLSEATSSDLFVANALELLGPLVRQAELLAAQYDAVVANPPYMGTKSFNPKLKSWVRENYLGYHRDLFSAFIARLLMFSRDSGNIGVMTSYVWMFSTSYEHLRLKVIDESTISSLVQLHYDAFTDAKAHICTFSIKKHHIADYESSYVRLAEFPGVDVQGPRTLQAIRDKTCSWFFKAVQSNFRKVPGAPISYWVSSRALCLYDEHLTLGQNASAKPGLSTGDNERFLRLWHEVSQRDTGLGHRSWKSAQESQRTWFPHNKGGSFRKWYGKNDYLINWKGNGAEIKTFVVNNRADPNTTHWSRRIVSAEYYFLESVATSGITSITNSFRHYPAGALFDANFLSFYGLEARERSHLLGFLNSKVAATLLAAFSPTLNLNKADLDRLPYVPSNENQYANTVDLLQAARSDWDAYERSWDFRSSPVLESPSDPTATLESSYIVWITQNRGTITEMKHLEEENNRLFIDVYGLQNELTPDVPIEQITLTVNPAYRYGGKLTEEELWNRFREDTMEELASYAIGCMMGRYSLNEPGLIYANSGNEGFDPERYTTFPADDDGIIPLTDAEWFDDDAANRLEEFISVAWDRTHLEQNLNFLADNLSPKKGEGSRDTIRRYLSDKFFKDHLQTYKKRPIYWLFSSGKEKAFQCLVYLHRYNEGTLARMRTEYVIPLTSKLATHVNKLEKEKDASATTAEVKKLEREIARLHKQQAELSNFDEKLRHYADQRVHLDLDDGVKVNYGKFGDLLAEVKAITGNKPVLET